jgi:hypothetical protein
MSKKTKLLFGTDPELVSVYEKRGALYTLPPYYFRKYLGVPASSDPKHPIFLEENGWKFHEDGAAFEMSVKPSFNPKELFDTIQECKRTAEERIISRFPEHCHPVLRFLPTVGFEVDRWISEGDDFRMSTRFGCDPDMDAFNIEANCTVIDASLHPERYCGGHIHFSGSKYFKSEPILAIKSLALTAGCASVLYSDVPELERRRTYLYGKPGKWRLQNYGKNSYGKDYEVGIEYRTISDTWCKSWEITEKIFNWATVGILELLEKGLIKELLPELSEIATTAIIEQDRELASQVLDTIYARV